MEFNFEKNIINVFSKSYKLEYVINKLSSLSGEQIHGFFSSRNVLIPRRLNCLALFSVINKKLRYINSNSFNRDFFERIQHYQYYTELQLYKLYKEVATYDDFLEYRKNLCKLLLLNYVALNFKDGEIQYLLNLKKLPIESFDDYFDSVSYSCCEQENTFDGQDITKLEETLEFSASTSDINELALKYGIKLPLKLRKDEFLGYIYWWFEKKDAINIPVEEEINNMTVNQLSDFAEKHGVGMSTGLTKSELVRYFLYVLTKYQLPKIEVKDLVVTEEFNPISFDVKIENASPFKTEKPKKVLYFEGDRLDKDTLAFENELSDIYNDVKEDEKNLLVDEEVKTYELPKKEIKVVVVNEVTKEDLNVLKYSKVKGVDLKTLKAAMKPEVEENIKDDLEDESLEDVTDLDVEDDIIDETTEEIVVEEESDESIVLTVEEEKVDEVVETVSSSDDYDYDDYEDEINGKPSLPSTSKKRGKLLKGIIGAVLAALIVFAVIYFVTNK